MVNVKYISSVEDLQNMGETGYYKLTKNINCEDFDFESIPRFEGTLDGAGHTIKNLKIQEYGLINYGKNITIKNLQFDNLNVDGFAGLIRDLYGKCKFENVIIKNSMITGNNFVGGFVSWVKSSSVVKCNNCKLVNSKITARGHNVGGFVGYVNSLSTVTCSNCKFVNSKVSAESDFVGGFVGAVYSSSILFSDCDVSKSNITARSSRVGGFVGYVGLSSVIVSDSVIEKSNLAGSYGVGGFVGYVYSSSIVVSVRNSVVNDCKVIAKEKYAGSIIGYDYYGTSVISNVPVLNTTVMVGGKKKVTNKVGNIDIESTVRGHSHHVPSRKPTTRKTIARRVPSRKPTARKTTCKRCATKRMVGKVKANYRSML